MSKPRGGVVLITPPFVQLSGPAAAMPFLAGALGGAGWPCRHLDLSIATALRLFSRGGLTELFSRIDASPILKTATVKKFLSRRRQYVETIDAVVAFLQGKQPHLAFRIIGRQWLPEGPRFAALDQLAPSFGDLETSDGAQLLASFYLDDLQDLAAATILPGFGLAKYQESLASSAPSLDPLLSRLNQGGNLIADLLAETLDSLDFSDAILVGITVPFPWNLFGALLCARLIRQRWPGLPIALGGGYVSTELREMADGRLFNLVDWLCFDDGVEPILALARHHAGEAGLDGLCRTLGPDGRGGVTWHGRDRVKAGGPLSALDAAAPDYGGLDHAAYLTLVESPNPMHRLWSQRGFFKLRMAEGCYWHRCSFCDTSLDYIARYRPVPTDTLVQQTKRIVADTGLTGIHFVDEAMPAAGARRYGEALSQAGAEGSLPPLVWWGNVRYDKSFVPEVARAMASGGCIGVSGGMEGVHPRILSAMDKGCTVQDMAGALAAFADAGIMTHAYLIYGFPGSTEQETIDALEIIRQCFAAGILHSAFWHRFILTVHSPAYRQPERFGITRIIEGDSGFARNDVAYEAAGSPDIDWMGQGLRTAVHNWMNQAGLNLPLGHWFERPSLAPSLPGDYIKA